MANLGGHAGVFVWDLRNTNQPVDHWHKYHDVFSLKATKSCVYVGTRKREIWPVEYHSEPYSSKKLQKFPNPHIDVVTSLATLADDQILISASRDKNLKGWAAFEDPHSSSNPNISSLNVTQAHEDQIRVIQSSKGSSNLLYSGSKDGVVKVWKLNSDFQEEANLFKSANLAQVGQILPEGPNQDVNTIAALEEDLG